MGRRKIHIGSPRAHGITTDKIGAVPVTRKINNKPLSGDVTLGAGDVGAVPVARKVNGKQLNADITLTAQDVGAAAANHGHSFESLSGKVFHAGTSGSAWVHVPVAYN